MKLIMLLIGIFCFNSQFICGQIAQIKKNISELFFELPIEPTKFDVRKLFHNDNNFSDIDERDYSEIVKSQNYEVIGADFKNNYKLSYLTKNEKEVAFYFNKGIETSYAKKIYFNYFADELSLCQKQFDELNNIFKKNSYKTKQKKQTKIIDYTYGEEINFYSSLKSLNEDKPYITMSYRYFKPRSKNMEFDEEYIFIFMFYYNNLY